MNLQTYKPIRHDESVLFNFLRGLSALFVFIGHIYQTFVRPLSDIPSVTRVFYILAGYSVMVFFVLSGYMIGTTIYRNISARDFKGFSLASFMKDRLLRLYPPLILAFLIVLLICVIANILIYVDPSWTQSTDLMIYKNIERSIYASLFFLQNMVRDFFPIPNQNFPLWSLSQEFWFYVIGALVIKSAFSRNIVPALGVVVFFGIMLIYGNWESFVPGFVVWALGLAFAFLHQNFVPKGVRISIVLMTLALISGVAWFLSVSKVSVFGSLEAKYAFGALFSFITALVISLQIPQYLRLETIAPFKKIVDSSQYSYTLYIIHYPILSFIYAVYAPFNGNNLYYNILISFASFFAILGIASYCARFVENKPFIVSSLSRLRK